MLQKSNLRKSYMYGKRASETLRWSVSSAKNFPEDQERAANDNDEQGDGK